MKKLLMLFITVISVFGLAACGTKTTNTTTVTTGATTQPSNPNSINDLKGNKTTEEWKEYYKSMIGIDADNNGVVDWQETPMTITYASKFYDDEDAYNTIFKNALKWAAQYPNITVVRSQKFLHSTGEDKDENHLDFLVSAAQENSMPDIFYSPLSAEAYDKGLTLDLLPYLRTDEESKYITQNAVDFIKTYDGEEIYGVPWMSVSHLPAINVKLLNELNIAAPGYDWTYEDYEDLRLDIAENTDAGECVFPGVIDWSIHGPNYFDSIPNGWAGFNLETQRFDFASATNFGNWFKQVADEGKWGWHFFDILEEDRVTLCGNFGYPWGDNLEAIGNIWYYDLSKDITDLVKVRNLDIDIYPMPEAPEGGTTSLKGYYDTLSLSYTLADNRVKAEATYDLLKWLTYGEDGTESRWAMIDEEIEEFGWNKEEFIENGGAEEDFPRVHPSTHLMDYIQGWPVTVNPKVMENHPLVKGFDENSPFAIFNFEAFKDPVFQAQLSGPVAYPRHIPAAARAFGHLNTWDMKNQIKDEGYGYTDIAGQYDEMMNTYLDDYLRNYNK